MALRSGVVPNLSMWSILVRLLCAEGKLEKAITVLNSGISSPGLYNLVINYYSKKGELQASINLLNEMSSKGFVPGFDTYSSILDGACKFQDVKVIDTMVDDMVEKEFLLKMPSLDYDEIITKLCALGKAFAAEMFFNRAVDNVVDLRDSSYVSLLKVFSKEGRAKEAMKVYGLILQRGIKLNFISNSTLVSVLCRDEPSEEADCVLKNVIRSGYMPSGADLSKYLTSLCNKGKWIEAEKILNLILGSGSLPDDASCNFCSLVEYYCSNDQLDLAIALHDKMEKLGQSLDVTYYNVLLDGLSVGKRIVEAIKVFDHMKSRNIVNAQSFSTMITALCTERDMKKAMKLHDEMIKRGLKPDEDTYKRLISGFF
ncbi:pentatricopeptide repeat-containing protein At4g21170 [Aristolochia californica]|uniref:pentatricopeptide repeat-containing protein At4g21170 n=1 Tax=Aristolochia californica TaxID=171875 RepID=UPI0035DEAF7D